MSTPIRVLVVDDSAFMRKTISMMLNSSPHIKVIGEAVDGIDAIEKVKKLSPDVVTLDVEMPRMNGLDALKIIMKENPLPVIMVSSVTEDGARETIKALEYGAVDYIPKNLSGNISNIINIKHDLLEKVRHFGRKKIVSNEKWTRKDTLPLQKEYTEIKVVVIGVSTGGPKALQEVIPKLPKNFPCGILVVQHMLPLFTSSFAERMNELSDIDVKEAKEGDPIQAGYVLIAPGGYHIKIKKLGDRGYVTLSKEPVLPYTPSVDIAMESAAQAYAHRVIGVIMTGMGSDGKEGIKAIKKANGKTIAQDENTSAIFGMPKAAIESGCVDKVVPLERIATEIINML